MKLRIFYRLLYLGVMAGLLACALLLGKGVSHRYELPAMFQNLTLWLPFDRMILQDQPVFSRSIYTEEKGLFEPVGNHAVVLFDGIVKQSKDTVEIMCDNGLRTVYHLHSDVNIGERLRAGDILGPVSKPFQIDFYLNEQQLTYAQALRY